MSALVLGAIFGVIVAPALAAESEELTRVQAELVRAWKENRRETEPFQESERVLRLYDRAWVAIASDATAWIQNHSGASSDRLAAAIERLSPAAAERCRHEEWASETDADAREHYWQGTPPAFEAFDPFYESCWAIDARAVRLGSGESTYAAYVTFGFQGRVMLLSTNAGLSQYATLPRSRGGGIYTLPDEAGGRHRFYVDARPADDMPIGARACRQLQIFAWNGQTLEALIDRNYSVLKGTSISWDGHALEVRTKGDIRSFGTCGACDDLDALWRIDVTPEVVYSRDLVYDQPLFPLIDEFIVRVRDGGDWHELGSPRAARTLAALLEGRPCTRRCAFDLVGGSVQRVAGKPVVTLALEGEPNGTVAFEVGEHDGHAYVEDVRFKARPDRP